MHCRRRKIFAGSKIVFCGKLNFGLPRQAPDEKKTVVRGGIKFLNTVIALIALIKLLSIAAKTAILSKNGGKVSPLISAVFVVREPQSVQKTSK